MAKKSRKNRADNDIRNKNRKKTNGEEERGTPSFFTIVFPFLFAIAAIIVLLCLIIPNNMGIIGTIIHDFLYGILGRVASFLIPVIMFVTAIFWRRDVFERNLSRKISFGILNVFLFSILSYLFEIEYFMVDGTSDPFFDLVQFYHPDKGLGIGGGVIGDTIGFVLYKLLNFGSYILVIALLILFIGLMFGKTPSYIVTTIKYKIHVFREKRREENERLLAQYKEDQAELEKEQRMRERAYKNSNRHQNINPNPTFIEEKPIEETEEFPMIDPEQPVETGLEEKEENSFEDNLPHIDEEVFEEIKKEEPAPLAYNIEDIPFEADAGAELMDDLSKNYDEDDDRYHSEDEIFSNKQEEQSETKQENVIETAEVEQEPSAPSTDDSSSARIPDAPLSEEMIKQVQNDMQAQKEGYNATDDGTGPDTLTKHKPKIKYSFPPMSALTIGNGPENTDISQELQTTAKRLVDTLNTFKVKTKIVHISRGPTITRYELLPEEGTRVRQIVNLVDDIALNLATSGVRIEAPIPGKQAVGIEVPNLTVSTVWLRELLDTPKFKESQSKLTVGLGKDVAGDPIFVDVAKTPHMLIAGATGMGKSVCINSMLISMLYKAGPEEVKLILIDPKKVEMNMYKNLPHLLVPVVSDAKKAAAALSWAVGEMERRYSLIEEAGVRDIRSYNASIENDPDKDFLPQIVIVIDELADLMMMAKDSVEESICRIAQKARAAGMHLIIGTQRPSVNVVTGLIKANIPSRIAFTMTSQVDSRTVIDMAGAEKLIGRGDMLFAPVGAMKPIRVQGAFVPDDDIDKVLIYIKDHCGSANYDEEVIQSIEKESEKFIKKDGANAEDGEIPTDGENSILKIAVELAIDAKKISTSLMQRKLHIGYGKAASIIDEMEERGFVSAPDGQKPRDVLITKEEFMQLVMNGEL